MFTSVNSTLITGTGTTVALSGAAYSVFSDPDKMGVITSAVSGQCGQNDDMFYNSLCQMLAIRTSVEYQAVAAGFKAVIMLAGEEFVGFGAGKKDAKRAACISIKNKAVEVARSTLGKSRVAIASVAEGDTPAKRAGKAYCGACDCYVNAEGHADRCKPTPSKVSEWYAKMHPTRDYVSDKYVGDAYWHACVIEVMSVIGIRIDTVCCAKYITAAEQAVLWRTTMHDAGTDINTSDHSRGDLVEATFVSELGFRTVAIKWLYNRIMKDKYGLDHDMSCGAFETVCKRFLNIEDVGMRD